MKTDRDTPLFLKACRGESIPRRPVWMMRQAGRYLPEYRALRARHDFLTLCKTPELAAQVTIQPVDILGVDGAVIFSDILLLLEAMGLTVRFQDKGGPCIQNPIRSRRDVERLFPPGGIDRHLKCVGEAIRLTAQSLAPRNIPIIGFAGAPFTLACYAIEGKTERDFSRTRRFMNEEPSTFAKLLKKIGESVVVHLQSQIQAGASAVQIFDTWGGILSQDAYHSAVLPSLRQVIASLKSSRVPVILYLNGSTPHLESMAESGADVLSVDWRLPLSKVRARIGNKIALQGNLDPAILYSSRRMIAQSTRAMLADHPGSGLIANLGHGILPDVPVEHARTFINTVKRWKV